MISPKAGELLIIHASNITAFYTEISGAGGIKAPHQVQQRRFTRTRRSHNSNKVTRCNIEAHPVKGNYITSRKGIDFCDLPEPNDRFPVTDRVYLFFHEYQTAPPMTAADMAMTAMMGRAIPGCFSF